MWIAMGNNSAGGCPSCGNVWPPLSDNLSAAGFDE
jgi:hypothetical protein